MVKKEAKWLELKEKAPELAFSILEDVDEFGNSNVCQSKFFSFVSWTKISAQLM
jgi:hypothetical protein